MSEPAIFLLDNGSLQPEAIFALRKLAETVSTAAGYHVEPVSLLHSNKIPVDQVGGIAAETFSGALLRHYANGARNFLIVPLFFGPSGAIVRYLPERIGTLKEKLGPFSAHVTPWLASFKRGGDVRIAEMLYDAVEVTRRGLVQPTVILVDHGSPEVEVAGVRNHLAAVLRERLGDAADRVIAASMERRPEPEYDFNEPLLARVLNESELAAREIVVAMQFLLPGRHAGPGGDVAVICSEAGQRHPQQAAYMTPLVAEHPSLVDLLADRIQDGLQESR